MFTQCSQGAHVGQGGFWPISAGGRPAWPDPTTKRGAPARSPGDRARAVVVPDLGAGRPGDRRIPGRRLDRDPLVARRNLEFEDEVLLLALQQADLRPDDPGGPVGAGHDLLRPALEGDPPADPGDVDREDALVLAPQEARVRVGTGHEVVQALG